MAQNQTTKLGDVFARQFRVVEARTAIRQWEKTLEQVARQVGADLSDPDQFQVVDELVRGS